MAEGRWQLEVDLPATEQAAAGARRLLRQALASWDHMQLAEDAGVVVSELVTNAVQHAGRSGQLRLDAWLDGDGCLSIAVNDEDTALVPVVGQPSIDAEAGRGLLIVEQLSIRWGVDMHPGRGKRVWAVLG